MSVTVPQIIQSSNVVSDVELKNLESWTLSITNDDSGESKTQDTTWAQFRNKDIQNKQRVTYFLLELIF